MIPTPPPLHATGWLIDRWNGLPGDDGNVFAFLFT